MSRDGETALQVLFCAKISITFCRFKGGKKTTETRRSFSTQLSYMNDLKSLQGTILFKDTTNHRFLAGKLKRSVLNDANSTSYEGIA